VRIYSKSETDKLYPRSGESCNNSFVDIDNLDEEKFKDFASAVGMQAIIEPGEVLYLPRHWWHYVRSLGVSFACSMWWGARMGLRKEVGGSGGSKATWKSVY